MWERAEASGCAYLLELTVGMSILVPPFRFVPMTFNFPFVAFWSTLV